MWVGCTSLVLRELHCLANHSSFGIFSWCQSWWIRTEWRCSVRIFKQTTSTIASIIPQLRGLCVFIFKIANSEGNLDAPPTLLKFFARNFCHALTSLQVDFRKWDSTPQTNCWYPFLYCILIEWFLCFYFKIANSEGNLPVPPTWFIFSREISVMVQAPFKSIFDDGIALHKQTAGTIVSRVLQLSSICVFIFKIANSKGNLPVFQLGAFFRAKFLSWFKPLSSRFSTMG